MVGRKVRGTEVVDAKARRAPESKDWPPCRSTIEMSEKQRVDTKCFHYFQLTGPFGGCWLFMVAATLRFGSLSLWTLLLEVQSSVLLPPDSQPQQQQPILWVEEQYSILTVNQL